MTEERGGNITTVASGFRSGFGGCFGVLAAIVVLAAIGSMFGHTPQIGDNPAKPETWARFAEKSKFTDTENVSYIVQSNEEYRSGFGSHRARLIIECRDRETMAYIDWDQYLGLGAIPVRYRVGSRPAVQSRWEISTDYRAAFAPRPIIFAKRLIGASVLAASVTPYGENTIEVTFNIAGFEKPAAELAAKCRWPGGA